jgi:hypothetical protein
MGIPVEQLLIVDRNGHRVDVNALLDDLRGESGQVLADDEFGLVLYVGDLDLFALTPTDSGEFLAQPVTEISRARFGTRILRRQIGATVMSVTSDAVFVIRDGSVLRKVRAEDLTPGMVLASGEKVYR